MIAAWVLPTAVAAVSLAALALIALGSRTGRRRSAIRVLVAATLALATSYVCWRWLHSVNWAAWWIAVPLILAETFSYLDSWLFGLTMWRLRVRGPAPPPPSDATVDVLITCYGEPVELVRTTAIAARDLHHPHATWILDDGASPAMEQMARAEGIGYITRGEAWRDRPRHAKAGNLNNALFATSGEFLLILDADQIPDPHLLERTLGWFHDPRVALVQTPQYFTNVPRSDPLGSQAPLFYGPIQQGKDGWNAAFFCGSNAVLRREALMQLGIVGYVREVEDALRRVLRTADRVVHRSLSAARRTGDHASEEALLALGQAIGRVRAGLAAGESAQEVTHAFRREVDRISLQRVRHDVEALQADVAALTGDAVEVDAETGGVVVDDAALDRLASRELSPLTAIASVRKLLIALDAVRGDEAQAVMPMATISVTEDMATAMRLHALGWRSVYHDEILARGLAPEDLRSMLQQRLRWAQGTLQVMLRENPLTQRGLSAGQRLMYFSTMWTYLSGFAALIYLVAPIIYLVFGVLPVQALSGDFFWHLIPFLVANQLLFIVVGWGRRTWRGQQYSLALFPLWITAVATVVRNVALGRELGFVVTPKTRQGNRGAWRLVRWQLIAMGALVGAVIVGFVRLAVGETDAVGAVVLNVGWVVYDLAALSVVVDAARYGGFQPSEGLKEVMA